MKPAELRSTLEQIAAGKEPGSLPGSMAPAVTVDAVKRSQAAFRAWHAFTVSAFKRAGEPLAAPSDVLTPLP